MVFEIFTGAERRRFPWELIVVLILIGVAVALVTFALLPPAPPPYVK